MQIKWFRVAALLGALGVIFGAFGAHALKATLETSGSLSSYKTAVLYHMLHSFFMLAIIISPFHKKQVINTICLLASLGILFFSGSLYLLTTLKWNWLGPVTPIGGLLLISSWIYAAVKASSNPKLTNN